MPSEPLLVQSTTDRREVTQSRRSTFLSSERWVWQPAYGLFEFTSRYDPKNVERFAGCGICQPVKHSVVSNSQATPRRVS